MLAGLRRAAKSKLAIPIIVLLAVSFAVWGVSDAFTNRGADAVATVGPEKVSMTEYAQLFSNQVQQISQQSGRAVTTQEARDAGLDQQLLNQMVAGAAFDAKAGHLALGASDAAILRDVRETEAFQDTVRGEFSRDVYASLLSQAGLTPNEYEASLRQDLTRAQIAAAVGGATPPPSMLVEARNAYSNEQRTAEVLVLPPGLAEVDADPTEEDLQQVLENNAQGFTFPERRRLSVVWFDSATMEAIVEVSEEDVRDLFEFRRAELDQPATRSFVQLATQDRETAETAAERLRAGESPEAVAEALGLAEPLSQEEAGRQDVVDSAVAERLFEEGIDPRVVVVDGALGWAVVQITGGAEASEARFEDYADTLRQELAADSATDTLYDAIDAFEDARGAAQSLEEAAAAAGLAAHAYAPVDASGRDASGAFFVNLASAPDLLQEAFSMNPGEVSDLLSLPDSGFAVVRVDDILPQRMAELSEVREDAEQLWRAQRRDEALQEIGERAQGLIEGGASFAEAAAEIGQPARNELAIIKRGETAGAVSQGLSGALFGARQGELVSGRTANGGRALARVTRIEFGDEPDPQIAAGLADELENDLVAQFQTALMEEYPVRIYPDQIDVALGVAEQ